MKIWVMLLLALPLEVLGDVVINEIHYDPPDRTKLEEFVELYNAGSRTEDLSGWFFSDGISHTFPQGTVLAPEQYLVVALSPTACKSSFGADALGPFDGFLASEGERIVLRDALGALIDEVDYQVGFPWPTDSAGDGSSMELIHPLLDNNLGGSWRASGASPSLPESPVDIVPSKDPAWHYRKGTSEASDPPSAWRAEDFVEDASWLVGPTSVGFGDDDDLTVLDDMLGNYTSVYLRHSFHIPGEEQIPDFLRLKMYVDDGSIVWINGVEVARFHVTAGDRPFDGTGQGHEARWEEKLLSGCRSYLKTGANLLAVHALNQSLTSNDFSMDAALVIPARSELPPVPTPGSKNTVYSTSAPPQVRQVDHTPLEPAALEAAVVTAKVTDPDGVLSVSLHYQIVEPGKFIPAWIPMTPSELMATPTKPLPLNPEFADPAKWTTVPMLDDGAGADGMGADGVYSAALPPQKNRTLVRYRITAVDKTSAEVTVPYPDDNSLNFALFVYDGVPPYQATTRSVHPEGAGHVYGLDIMEALPVYTLITRAADMSACLAYNGAFQIPKGNEAARDAFNWEGAFVYEGVAYDHVTYRLRQANDRYGGSGKRSMRIRFHKGRYLDARDNAGHRYPTRWRTLNVGKQFDNLRVGNFGLTETLNAILWNMVGVPAPVAHTFHFRVVDGVDEVPAGANGQYYGDFWGMFLAVEDYDPRFLEAHGLPDGNLYKLKDGIFVGNQLKRNQGRFSVTTDADFQNIRTKLRPTQTDDWLNQHVRYERWYPYKTVVEAIRHYDFVPADSHSKNRAWFFEPAEGTPFGLLWTLPHDADASWGPNWNSGIDYSTQAIFGPPAKPAFKLQYRNVIREFRDLLWRPEVINVMIDDLAALVLEFSYADRDRWRGAPADAGNQDYGRLEDKVKDMKNFAFVGWSGATGPTVPAGGRAAHLDRMADAEGDAASIPRTPAVTAVTPDRYPADGLVFEASPFSDPQGDDSFGAMKWRLAEVDPPEAPPPPSGERRLAECNAVWESEELATFQSRITVPSGVARPGHRYRVRVRMMDSTLRWSHWSQPLEFTAGDPQEPIPQLQHLRVTEIMYNPPGDNDFEFIEIQNTGRESIDLTGVRLTAGIEFSFEGSAVTELGPGGHVVVVNDERVFATRYRSGGIPIAGAYAGKLDNAGEQVVLSYRNMVIQDFTYDDTWYPQTDGDGFSLVIIDPAGAAGLWSSREGWRASTQVFGSPGKADPGTPPADLVLQGDINGDSRLDITDAISLLGHLFLGSPSSLRCGDGTAAHEANQSLLDLSGDGMVNITDPVHALNFLFKGGPPPALGTDCVQIPGCPAACAR